MNEELIETELISKQLQLDLEKGELEWADDIIQFFIPVALYHTNFEWLRLIAENNCIEEDEKVIKNFLSMVESLIQVNTAQLNDAVSDKIKKLFR